LSLIFLGCFFIAGSCSWRSGSFRDLARTSARATWPIH